MKKLGLTAAIFVFAAVFVSAQNMFKNGDFSSGIGGWQVYTESGGKASVKAANGELEFAIASVGNVGWASQAYPPQFFRLEKGSTYKFSFDVHATTQRDIQWCLQLNGAPYTNYADEIFTVGTAKKHVELTFTMEQKTDPQAKLCLNCGNWKKSENSTPAHSIFFDNFKLEKVN